MGPQDAFVPRGRRPAAFLDRDGVINVDHGYVSRPEDLVFTPTAAEGIRLLNDAGYLVIVVSNQSGVARGMYGMADVDRFHDHMQAMLAERGARIDAFYYCPYHPDGSIEAFSREHEDRKPGTGMLLRAIEDWSILTDESFMIGDKSTDVIAARRVGIPGLLVASDTCDLAAAAAAMLAQIAAAVHQGADGAC